MAKKKKKKADDSTTIRSVRVPTDEWEYWQQVVKQQGTSVSAVIRQLMHKWALRNDDDKEYEFV